MKFIIDQRSEGRGVVGGGGRGDDVSKEIGGSVRLPVWRHVSRRWLSKWRTKCSSKRRIKISNLSRQYCSDFLDLEILRALSVIEKQTLVLFWNETSSGVMNFKISFYRLANFTGNQTSLGPVHSKMKECWHSNRRFIKWYIILYIVRTFNSSEPVEPHINPFKVRLAGSVERRR